MSIEGGCAKPIATSAIDTMTTSSSSEGVPFFLRVPGKSNSHRVPGTLVIATDGFFSRSHAFGNWRAHVPIGPDPNDAVTVIAQQMPRIASYVTPDTFHPMLLASILDAFARFDGMDPNEEARSFAQCAGNVAMLSRMPMDPTTGFVKIDGFLEEMGTTFDKLYAKPAFRRHMRGVARSMGVPLESLITRGPV